MDHGEPLTWTLDEAAQILGVGRSSIYRAAHTKQIPVIRIGKKFLVPRAAFEKFLADAPMIRSTWPAEPLGLRGPTTRFDSPLRAMRRHVRRAQRRLDAVITLLETRATMPIVPAEIAALATSASEAP